MFGQGCPHLVLRICTLLIAAIAIVSASISAPISVRGSCFAQEPEPNQRLPEQSLQQNERPISTNLRFSWGGGESQTWRGTISIDGGTFSSVAPIGVTLDAPASVRKSGKEILIDHWSPTNYGGADIVLSGAPDTSVRLQLSSVENPESVFEKTITVKELIGQTIAAELDTTGNRFSVSRAPGDVLQVEFDRQHLVFAPKESFRFSIEPTLTGLETRTANCRVKVVLADSSGVGARALYSKSVSVSLDENGSATESIELEVPIPDQEEVYDIEMELEPVWYQASFGGKSNTIKRSIQFIVLDEQSSLPGVNRRWRQVSVSDSADMDQAEGFSGWNQIPKIGRSGRSGRSSLGNELRSTTLIGQEKLVTLQAGGWQAIPLDVGRLGEPHVIELEYVSDEAIAMGMSVLQPDASGQIPLYGFDSGLFVPDSWVTREVKTSDAESKIEHHRITVWPSTKTPYLLVANRHASSSVTIGKVRVFAGPSELPAKEYEFANKNSRKLMAFYESPLFAENFGALAITDPNIVEPLDDWRMFYTGAERLIEYLKSNSFRGAFITVACDGSSIYPSQFLASTPKHDNGTFFESGQDPIRKDVLEMLFRMFEREGLTLVPSLALSAPLPEVERSRGERSRKPGAADGFDLVDINAVKRPRAIGDGLPVYNPLDRQVQQAVTRVVEEVAGRYKQYSSFDGIAIVCRPDTHTLLPGRQWGYDDSTVTQFIESQSDLESNQLQTVRGLLTGTYRKQWIQWRADQMTFWYQDMLAKMRQSVPEGSLYLAPVDLYRNDETASALSPSLHASNDFEQVMMHAGFDLDRLQPADVEGQPKSTGGIVLLNPHRVAPEESFASQRVDYAIQHSPQAQAFFAKSNYRGDLFTHRIAWAHFLQLQEQSPFGIQTSNLMRLQPMAPAQQFNRRRFVEAIKERDSRLLVDGGSVLTLGQEPALADLMRVFNQLPDEKFADVTAANAAAADGSQVGSDSNQLPIAVRQLRSGSESFFYVANASPWPIQFRAAVKSGDNELPVLDSLSRQNLLVQKTSDQSTAAKDDQFEVVFEIPAYGLVGARSTTVGFEIQDFEFTLPEGADKVLKKQVYALEAKLLKSSQPTPLDAINNPDFESKGQPLLSGWDVGQQATGKVRLSSTPETVAPEQEGTASLLMSNQGDSPVWIRSNPFAGPTTGRLSISVWLRINDTDVQPPLRLAVEGRSKGANYYRFGSVGSLSPDPSLNQVDSKWKRFAVHFDDLPIDGLSNVRVGFDLMGPGEVLIDNVQIYDRWFDENDAKAITQMLASTGPLLSKPETIDSCRRLLESYWVQFLDRYVENSPANVASNSSVSGGGQSQGLQGQAIGNPEVDSSFEGSGLEQNEIWTPQEKSRVPMFRRFRNLAPARKPQLR